MARLLLSVLTILIYLCCVINCRLPFSFLIDLLDLMVYTLYLVYFGPHSSGDHFVNNWSTHTPDLPPDSGGQGSSIATVKTYFLGQRTRVVRDYTMFWSHYLSFGRTEGVLISLERPGKAEHKIYRQISCETRENEIVRRRTFKVAIERLGEADFIPPV